MSGASCSTRAASASRATATHAHPPSSWTSRRTARDLAPRRVRHPRGPGAHARGRPAETTGRPPRSRPVSDPTGPTGPTAPEDPARKPAGLVGLKPGDRRVRVERPRAAYFRYEGPGVLVARAKASEPTTPLGKALARVRRSLLGRPAGDRRGDRRAAVQAQGAGHLQLGRHLVERLCHRRDPARAGPGRRGRPDLQPGHRHRHRHHAGGRLHQLPPDRLRLPQRRRRVRRRARPTWDATPPSSRPPPCSSTTS